MESFFFCVFLVVTFKSSPSLSQAILVSHSMKSYVFTDENEASKPIDNLFNVRQVYRELD